MKNAPVVFNPVLMIPMWINAVVGCIITWIPMSLGLLDIPAATLTTGQVPAPFGYLILTGDFRVFIFYVIAFIVFWLIWLPFFKTYEKQVLAEEQQAVDGRHADQQIRGAVVLPHGTGKKVRVLVFAKNAKADEALAAGAEYVGAEELIPKIQNENWFEFDVVVATPDMMGVVGRLGRVLGPKGLMPNPKAGTVTMDVTKAVQDIKAGKIEYRLDKTNIIHVPIGKASFTEEQLADNFQTLMSAIIKAKPSALKGQYLKSVVVAPTMGPAVKLNTAKFV